MLILLNIAIGAGIGILLCVAILPLTTEFERSGLMRQAQVVGK